MKFASKTGTGGVLRLDRFDSAASSEQAHDPQPCQPYHQQPHLRLTSRLQVMRMATVPTRRAGLSAQGRRTTLLAARRPLSRSANA